MHASVEKDIVSAASEQKQVPTFIDRRTVKLNTTGIEDIRRVLARGHGLELKLVHSWKYFLHFCAMILLEAPAENPMFNMISSKRFAFVRYRYPIYMRQYHQNFSPKANATIETENNVDCRF